MGKIYGQASNVKVWLGEDTLEKDVEIALNMISRLYKAAIETEYKKGTVKSGSSMSIITNKRALVPFGLPPSEIKLGIVFSGYSKDLGLVECGSYKKLSYPAKLRYMAQIPAFLGKYPP
jgi:hypothetical protein